MEWPTLDRFSVTGSSDRENSGTILKNIFFIKGWTGMGVNNLPFIIFALIICFSPFTIGLPLKKNSGKNVFSTRLDTVQKGAELSIFGESDHRVYYNGSDRINNVYVNDSWDNLNRILNNKVPHNNRQRKRHIRAKDTTKKKPLFVSDEVQNYLMNFGYLPQSDRETGLLRTDDQLRKAIENLQNFANIPATGELDEATQNLLKKPRCGLPDFPSSSKRKKRYTIQGQKWPYTNLTWSLRTLEPRGLDGGQVRAVLYHALDVWAKHSRLTFQEVNSDRADILIYFHSGYHGDGYAFDGRGQVLAHAFFPGKDRGGDAHFDEDEMWILDPRVNLDEVEGTSLFSVAAHEFGHSLGLSHSSVQGALMFPWYQGLEGLTFDLQLPEDDRHGIQQLYGTKETKIWARIPSYEPYHPRPETPRPEPPRREPPRPESPRREPPRPEPPRREPPRPEPPRREPSRPEPPRREPARPEPPRREPPRPETPNFRPTWSPRPPPPTIPPEPPRVPHYPKVPEKSPTIPDTCNTNYDAISVIRNEVFIFKDKYIWRIGDQGLKKGYPAEVHRLWFGLPKNITRVDAVYERNDKKIVFFIGKMYYVFDANYLLAGYPKPLHYLGLPRELDHIDGAMVWGHNKKTYFFSGTMYWKFDDESGRVELDYPRDMSMWKGVGYNIDAVFQWKDGITYFFKNKGFWKFNDMRMRVYNERQMLSAPFWMGCPKANEIEPVKPEETTNPTIKYRVASSSSELISNIHCFTLIIATTVYLVIA